MTAPTPAAATEAIGQIVEQATAQIVAGYQTQLHEAQTALAQERSNVDFLAESVAQLEQSLYEAGWTRMLGAAEYEFSAEGLRQMRAICKLYALKSPLIKRGLILRSAYVWGKGVEITARANGKADGEQDVQAVVSALLDDPDNQRNVTGAEARDTLERYGLGTEGEVFIAAVPRPLTGAVQLRTISPDEICDIVPVPGDAGKIAFYRRDAIEQVFNFDTGTHEARRTTTWYPALDYRPVARRASIGGAPVDWTTRILHVKANSPRGWLRGIPDAYAAIDWAKAYKEFLEDWARLMRSLSRYAWKATTPGKAAAKVRTAVETAPAVSEASGKVLSAGATAILPPDVALEAISKSGATIDAESGRPIAMMVASALGIPVTMLLSDPGQTGARATAETLDQPTELEMGQRRQLWEQTYRSLIDFAILESVRAPQGKLKGSIIRDPFTGREYAVLDGPDGGETTQAVDFTWPDLDDTNVKDLVEAIVAAAGTGAIDGEQIVRLLLTALGVTDVDGIVEKMLDPETGEFLWPQGPSLGPAPPTDGTDPGPSMMPDPDTDLDGGGDGGLGDGEGS